MNEWSLLRQYVDDKSDAAFAALVERYINLVYSTCLRELNDATLAEDVTQVVFLILARKASRLPDGTVLTGWLFKTARYASRNARQQELRRQVYEQQAVQETMHAMTSETMPGHDATWQGMEPLLHAALDSLSATDRHAVLLRFFDDKSLRETSIALNISEEAARKRVSRAVEKMRRFFSERGVAVSGVLLATLLSANASQAAPATCLSATLAATSTLAPTTLAGVTAGAKVQAMFQATMKAMLINKVAVTSSLVATICLAGAGTAKLMSLSPAGLQRSSALPAVRLAKPLTAAPAAIASRPATLPRGMTKQPAPGPVPKQLVVEPVEARGRSLKTPATSGVSTPLARRLDVFGENATRSDISTLPAIKRMPMVEMPRLLPKLRPPELQAQPPKIKERPESNVEAVPSAQLELQIGHNGTVEQLAFSADGKLLATGSDNGMVLKVWDYPRREQLWSQAGLLHARFLPDSQQLAAVEEYRRVNFYEARTGKLIRTLALPDNSGTIFGLSPDGRVVCAINQERVSIFDAVTGARRHLLLSRLTQNIALPVYSANGKLLALHDTNQVEVWDLENGRLLQTVRPNGPLQTVALSPDGAMLAVGGQDSTAQVWRTATGDLSHTLEGLDTGVTYLTYLTYSADGAYISGCDTSGMAAVWNAAGGAPLKRISAAASKSAKSLAFAPDLTAQAGGHAYELAAGGNYHISLFNDQQPDAIDRLRGLRVMSSRVIAPDGKKIVATGVGSGVAVWNFESGDFMRKLPISQSSFAYVGASGDGRFIFTVASTVPTPRTTISVWNTANLVLVKSFVHDIKLANAFATTHDGQTMAIAGRDGSIELLDIATAATKRVLIGHTRQVRSMAFTPDGKTLASGSIDKTLRLWDAASGELKRTIEESDELSLVASSPTGKLIASSTHNSGAVKLWDAETGVLVKTLQLRLRSNTTSLVFSGDGATLLTHSNIGPPANEVAEWDVATGQRRRTLTAGGAIETVAITSDASGAICGMKDGSIQIWDLPTRQPRVNFALLTNGVLDNLAMDEWIAYTPAGYYLGSPGAADFIRWRVQDSLMPAAKFARAFYRPELLRGAVRRPIVLTAQTTVR